MTPTTCHQFAFSVVIQIISSTYAHCDSTSTMSLPTKWIKAIKEEEPESTMLMRFRSKTTTMERTLEQDMRRDLDLLIRTLFISSFKSTTCIIFKLWQYLVIRSKLYQFHDSIFLFKCYVPNLNSYMLTYTQTESTVRTIREISNCGCTHNY